MARHVVTLLLLLLLLSGAVTVSVVIYSSVVHHFVSLHLVFSITNQQRRWLNGNACVSAEVEVASSLPPAATFTYSNLWRALQLRLSVIVMSGNNKL